MNSYVEISMLYTTSKGNRFFLKKGWVQCKHEAELISIHQKSIDGLSQSFIKPVMQLPLYWGYSDEQDKSLYCIQIIY